MIKKITATKIQETEIEDIVDLIEQYRNFYNAPAKNRVELIDFFKIRLKNDQSIIWVAFEGNKPVGFAQIYRSYTTVGLGQLWVLNDLYVAKDSRRRGIANLLVSTVLSDAKKEGISRADLKTAADNFPAKKLYDIIGFEKDELFEYFQYHLMQS